MYQVTISNTAYKKSSLFLLDTFCLQQIQQQTTNLVFSSFTR